MTSVHVTRLRIVKELIECTEIATITGDSGALIPQIIPIPHPHPHGPRATGVLPSQRTLAGIAMHKQPGAWSIGHSSQACLCGDLPPEPYNADLPDNGRASMSMTAEQNTRCHAIIHTAAAAAGAGNLIPVPGTGVAADMVAMTLMIASLAAVFGGNLSEEAARGLAFAAIKNTMLKQPIKVLAKELSKLLPFLGQIVAPTISVTLIEAAGWSIAEDLARRRLAA